MKFLLHFNDGKSWIKKDSKSLLQVTMDTVMKEVGLRTVVAMATVTFHDGG
jgi:hypothetical protein